MFLQILTLLGSLAMFLYGMSLMSGGLQKMDGNKMRVFMARMTSNNFKCILTGIGVTAMEHNLATPVIELTDIRNAEEAEEAEEAINISQSVIGAKSVRFRLLAAEKMIILAQ